MKTISKQKYYSKQKHEKLTFIFDSKEIHL